MGGFVISSQLNSNIHIVQVVRRFAHVGGMEGYVWELSAALAAIGYQVTVLCETNCNEPAPPGISVVSLGHIWPCKPSWLAALRYSIRVHNWLRKHKGDKLVHSHVRCGMHNVFTFHGPPFAQVKKSSVIKQVSLRVAMQLWLEKRDVMTPSVCAVVPNSVFISGLLREYYQGADSLITHPIPPGVSENIIKINRQLPPLDGGVIGFIGLEWKRKGLEKAIEIMNELFALRPNIKLVVAGPEIHSIQHLFSQASFKFELKGRVQITSILSNIDVLLHPALMEPYGMVIAEALASGSTVVISDRCGIASEIASSDGIVLSLDAESSVWADKIHNLLNKRTYQPEYTRTWQVVAQEYSNLYQQIWENVLKANAHE